MVTLALRMAILDALAGSSESINQIKPYVKLWGIEATEKVIFDCIQGLLDEKLVYIDGDVDLEGFTWYGLTDKGQLVLDSFDWDQYEEE